jgi:hypothetical protein
MRKEEKEARTYVEAFYFGCTGNSGMESVKRSLTPIVSENHYLEARTYGRSLGIRRKKLERTLKYVLTELGVRRTDNNDLLVRVHTYLYMRTHARVLEK